jgi:large subunit ribosomal protein L15
MADDPQLNLHTLKPAAARKDRKRIGRGMGSGKGRYSGRGIKGQKSRAGSHKMRAGFEGGQMPLYMRVPKQRGATSADAMPIVPFMTKTAPVNVRDLEARFDAGAEVTPESLVSAGILKNTKIDVKILGNGELKKKLSVSAHGFSASAREKIEAAGGTVSFLRGDPAEQPKVRSKKNRNKPARLRATGAVPEDAAPEAEAEAAETAEPENAAEAAPEPEAAEPEAE